MNEADPIFPGGAFQGSDDSSAVVGQITISMFSLRFETEGFILDLPMQGLQMDLDESGERVLFSHANYPDWSLYSLDPAILQHRAFQQQFLKTRVEALKIEHTGTPRHTIMVYSVLGGIFLILFSLYAFSNVILGMIVAAMPSSWEKQVGDASFSHISRIIKPMSDPAYTNRLYLVSQRLKKGLPEGSPNFTYMVGDDDMVNAIALPGGRVIVMRGLLDEATPDELAGVLSHEVSHVIRKHGMRHLAQMIGPILMFKFFADSDSALASLVAISAMLSSLEYSRSNETEADDYGWDILTKANVDPRSLTSFFRKIQKEERHKAVDPDLFSTHPNTAARIKHLEERWKDSPKKSGFTPINGGPDPKPAEKK